MKAPLCHACGHPLAPWRLIERVAVDKGHVKDARRMVCVPCRRVYRVTITTWRDGASENQPSHADWHRLATMPAVAAPEPGEGDSVDPAASVTAAAMILGPLVDHDRLDSARRAADLWPGLAVRTFHALANAMGVPLWRATRARKDAAQLGLLDLDSFPREVAADPPVDSFVCEECGHPTRTARGLGSHQLTHKRVECGCGWTGTAAEHRAHIRWHCPLLRPSDAS